MQELSLDTSFARSFFPSLSSGFVFMDNAGGSQTLRPVAERLSDYLLNSNVQHGASYEISQLAGARVYEASQHTRDYIHANQLEEIVLGPSTSMQIRILSLALSHAWKPGDEIIVTNTDHEANVSPWTDLKKKGIEIKIWEYNPETFQLELDDLKGLITDKTKLLAFTHASNVLGSINPVKEITKYAQAQGLLVCVDGVAYAPHRLPDVQELGVDFYIFSWYKVFGPHFALMYVKKAHLEKMEGINHYFIQSSPYKFQPGNVNFEFAYSLMGIFDYLEAINNHHFEQAPKGRLTYQKAFDLFTQQEEELSGILLDFLNSNSDIKIIGNKKADKSKRVSTISFVHEKLDSKEIVDQVDPFRIGIRYGDFYAKKLIEKLGIEQKNGVVRVSLLHYNTHEEVKRLISIFDGIFK
ncbi:MAG: aminotransferase class V-fold PLP-dependent enzyme [Bacteroidia bacterium]|nr:aminotransferase class V-fold PLP-dependent enzyme [Bacteroidia bacterium]